MPMTQARRPTVSCCSVQSLSAFNLLKLLAVAPAPPWLVSGKPPLVACVSLAAQICDVGRSLYGGAWPNETSGAGRASSGWRTRKGRRETLHALARRPVQGSRRQTRHKDGHAVPMCTHASKGLPLAGTLDRRWDEWSVHDLNAPGLAPSGSCRQKCLATATY